MAFVSSSLLNRLGVVSHGVTTRHGDLNLSFRTEPDPERVRRNRSAACAAYCASLDDLVVPEQVHANGVARVTSADRGRGAEDSSTAIPDVDALVTDVPGLLLGITIADCLPVFLVDPVRRAIGLAHSGWRGTAGEIVPKTLRLMSESFGSKPSDVIAAVGPGIHGDCYEVDEKVRAAFSPERWRAFRKSREGHWYLYLRAIVFDQLVESGVRLEAISIADYCTYCRRDLFFSHRGEGPGAGRMGAFLRLS